MPVTSGATSSPGTRNTALPVAENLLDRNFTPVAPNQVWTSDITYLWTDEGWLYQAIVLDLFNREMIGWSLKPRMTADIVTGALTMAWFRRRPAPGVMHHSDRGRPCRHAQWLIVIKRIADSRRPLTVKAATRY
jgi:transposase InsO family protein